MDKDYFLTENKETTYIVLGIAALGIALYLLSKSRKKEDNVGFVGVSKNNAFKSPYSKAKDQTGQSQLYRLSEFFTNQTRKIHDYTPVEILKTRILNGDKYYKINKQEWIMAENVRNIKS